nr:MAG TPA: hypothetical protein [Caudoviricetes sp.]
MWNSKSEVIKCLHEQAGQRRRILKRMISRFGLTTKR